MTLSSTAAEEKLSAVAATRPAMEPIANPDSASSVVAAACFSSTVGGFCTGAIREKTGNEGA